MTYDNSNDLLDNAHSKNWIQNCWSKPKDTENIEREVNILFEIMLVSIWYVQYSSAEKYKQIENESSTSLETILWVFWKL